MAKVVGLDIGSNSIGWALIDDEKEEVIDMGVRIFEAGVNEINTDKEESKNAERRIARQQRTQYERRKDRKRKLRSLLRENGMMPDSPNELKQFYKMEPYSLRKKALDSQLNLHEIGRALYQLNQRRGFKSNRKTQSDEENSGTIYNGAVGKPGINTLNQALNSGTFRTLGEYFAGLNSREIRIRERYTERSMFVDEFNKIWDKQSEFHTQLTNELKEAIGKECMFFQRPLASQKKLVGKCQFFPNKRRAPKSHPLFQRFRLLQQLNMFTIQNSDRIEEEEQLLRMNERAILLKYLGEHKELDLEKKSTLIKLLGLNKKDEHRCNLSKLNGLSTIIELRKALGSDTIESISAERLDTIYHTLLIANDEEWLTEYAKTKFNLTEEQAIALAKVRLEQSYGSLSIKAIRLILPFMEEGYLYHEAMEKAGLKHSVPQEKLDGSAPLLPPFNPKDVRNPIVSRALSQVRKVVNALIREYGKPDVFRVELARELKQPKSKRENTHKDNRNREKLHAEIRQTLLDELKLQNPSRDDIIRYKLWKEAQEHCPYTGEYISLHRLFFEDVDIEHILPYSRTLDDSQMNKTICVRTANIAKGDKTPWEAFHGTVAFEEIKERIARFPRPKLMRFVMDAKRFEEFVGDDFIARQLNDTRYISKEAQKFLAHVCSKVTVANGTLTSDLRSLWGFNSLLSIKEKVNTNTGEIVEVKNRDDHRHHAVDALVVACTTRSMLQKRSAFNAQEFRTKRIRFDLPWEFIREQAQFALSNIIVSHAVNKRVRGQLHEDTIYGMPNNQRVLPPNERYVVVRKPIRSLSPKEVGNIVDPAVKRAIVERYMEHGIDILNSKPTLTESKLNTIFEQPVRVPSTHGLGAMIKTARYKKNTTTIQPIRNGKAWIETGSNHHAVIFKTDANGKEKQDGEVVTLFEAVRRLGAGIEVVNRARPQGQEFLFSLQRGEMLIVDKHSDEISFDDKRSYHEFANNVFKVSIITQSTAFTLAKHSFSLSFSTTFKNTKELVPLVFRLLKASTLNAIKIKVNPIGKIEQDRT